MKKNNKKKGFTLVELVVVIAVLGILAAVAVPRLSGFQEKAKVSAHQVNIKTLENAAALYIAENGNPSSLQTATAAAPGVLTSYIQTWPTDPWKRTNTSYQVSIGTDGTITVSGVVEP